ncbi:MAG: Transketolase 1 [Candidatus Hydrogenedentes bacterium ADurb.Bin179]|nr:MAG: Transketolase 1 [Candidatus Hydrogenedentes bacterium ADurb.Bin179]
MPLTEQEFQKLQQQAKAIRREIVDVTGWSGGAHVGGALSMVDILTLLYWKYMRLDPAQPEWEDRDRFVLSKGHGGVGHAVVLAQRGYFNREALRKFNETDSMLGMHLDYHKVPGCETSTGSMGHGLSQAVGMALGARVLKKDWRVYCVIGDGESDEGSIWEAAMSAAHYKLDNLIVFQDRNRMMIDGLTEEVMSLEPLADKWRAFGLETREVDGHDLVQLSQAIEYALQFRGKPTLILCNTIKGKGVDFMENKPDWHYGGLSSELVEKAKRSIGE